MYFFICLPEEVMKYRLALRVRRENGYGTEHFTESKILLINSLGAALGYATMNACFYVAIFMSGYIQFQWKQSAACGITTNRNEAQSLAQCQTSCRVEQSCVGYEFTETTAAAAQCLLHWDHGSHLCFVKPIESFAHDLLKLSLSFLECIVFHIPMHVLTAYLIGLSLAKRHELNVAATPFSILWFPVCVRGTFFLTLSIFNEYITNNSLAGFAISTSFSVLCCCSLVFYIKRQERQMPATYLARVGYLNAFGYGMMPVDEDDNSPNPAPRDSETL
jgi:hypothetical protein